MKLNFRHGLVRHQTDLSNNPTFLQKVGAYVNLVVSPDPTLFTIAHFNQDYLFVENQSVVQAWGPFNTGTDYWLYWDVDLITGAIARGYTTVDPVTQSAPPSNPPQDQHWYDVINMVMKVYVGSQWVEVLRVFAAELNNGSVLVPFPVGSQIGMSGIDTNAGFPLFDDANQPVKRFRNDRKGTFIHTSTPLVSQWTRLANFQFEINHLLGEVTEYIPAFYAVAYAGPNQIRLARNTQPNFPAIGLATEDMYNGEVRSFVTEGYIENELWNWDVYGSQPPGSPVFVGPTGEVTTSPPQFWSIQQIGTIVDKKIIYLEIEPIILYG